MSDHPPFDYMDINNWETLVSPSTVHCQNNALHAYFCKYLEERAMSVFKWTIPEEWNAGKDFLRYTLCRLGFFTITELPASAFDLPVKSLIVPINCTLTGYGLWYQPTDVLIANPKLKEGLKRHIGTECTLIRLKPDYTGIWDIITYYADQLALIMESAGVNLINTRLAYVFASKNQAGADSMKTVYDMIAGGNPAVFVDKRLMNEDGSVNWQLFEQNVGGNYLVGDLISDYRKVMADFDAMIGIPNANTDKKERLISDEVNANNQETYALSDLMLETLKMGIEETKAMFGDIGFDIEYRNPKPEKGGQTDENEIQPSGSFEG